MQIAICPCCGKPIRPKAVTPFSNGPMAWTFGSGFPKSHDVSKAIDKMDAGEEQERRRLRFTAWVRAQSVTSAQIDEATRTNMGGHYTTAASQPAIMTREHLEACRHLFRVVPKWVERECDIRSVESKNMADREVLGPTRRGAQSESTGRYGAWGDGIIPTAPATDAARQWDGWGTALKPAWEPIIVARKPLAGTVAENVLGWGTGAINVDGCRVEYSGPEDEQSAMPSSPGNPHGLYGFGGAWSGKNPPGRWPANLIHDGSDEVMAGFPDSGNNWRTNKGRCNSGCLAGICDTGPTPINGTDGARGHTDTGSAARFFYCAKASRQDRDEGLEGMEVSGARPLAISQWEGQTNGSGQKMGPSTPARNHHPTVKPTELMRYLCRLVTPPGGVVLDPFMGSGSTGKAAQLEGFQFIGIEQDAEYCEIARRRIEAAQGQMVMAL